MIEVAGIWEQGWNTPILEVDLWEMAMREFGVERLNITPVSGISRPLSMTANGGPAVQWVFEYDSLQSILADREGLTPVIFDEAAPIDLPDFQHPENALYVFGRSGYSPHLDIGLGISAVRIPNKKPGCLWAHQAMVLALWDRSQKL